MLVQRLRTTGSAMAETLPDHAGTAGHMEGSVHVMPVRVYFADTDAGGVVYHASYLTFAERARTEMLRLCGYNHEQLMGSDGLVFAVRHCEIDFLKPAHLDNLLTLRSEVVDVGGSSLSIAQTISRGAAELARLLIQLVFIRLDDGRPVRLTAQVRAALKPLTPQAT